MSNPFSSSKPENSKSSTNNGNHSSIGKSDTSKTVKTNSTTGENPFSSQVKLKNTPTVGTTKNVNTTLISKNNHATSGDGTNSFNTKENQKKDDVKEQKDSQNYNKWITILLVIIIIILFIPLIGCSGCSSFVSSVITDTAEN